MFYSPALFAASRGIFSSSSESDGDDGAIVGTHVVDVPPWAGTTDDAAPLLEPRPRHAGGGGAPCPLQGMLAAVLFCVIFTGIVVYWCFF
ncbi:hypothetical protein ACP70R_044136 [Stipagrostis hirtigluma subsp. patula]